MCIWYRDMLLIAFVILLLYPLAPFGPRVMLSCIGDNWGRASGRNIVAFAAYSQVHRRRLQLRLP